jgi:Sec-independent protein translocase protein TatA
MAKKKAAKKKAPPKKKVAVKRAVSKQAREIGGAVGKAVGNFAKSLGEMKVDHVRAGDQMEELGTLLEDLAKAKTSADEKAEAAKTAKATVESKTNLLLEKMRGFTHPKSLPLFEAAEREADQKNMLDAVEQGGKAGDAPAGKMGL